MNARRDVVQIERRKLRRWLVVDVLFCVWFVVYGAWLAAHAMPRLAAFQLTMGLWCGNETLRDVARLSRRPL